MKKAVIFGTLFSATYGFIFVLQEKFIKAKISPIELNFQLYLFAFICSIILGIIQNTGLLFLKPSKGFFFAILSGICAAFLSDIFVTWGFKTSSSVNWSVLSRLITISTFFCSIIFLKEKFVLKKLIPISIATIGAIIVVLNFQEQIKFNSGDIKFIGAVIFFGLGNVFNQIALQEIKSNAVLIIRMATAFILFFISALLENSVTNFSIGLIFPAILGIITFLVAIFVNQTIKYSNANFFAILGNLIPIFSSIFSILLLKNIPSLNQIIGGVIILASIYFFSKK